MQIINFTEPLIKPALQDRSKCFTIRKAWDWLDEGQNKKACWREQEECRHKVGALEQIMWMQRGKNGVCCNCIHSDTDGNPDNCKYVGVTPCSFSKVFGVGKILQTPKVWMRITDVNRNGLLGNSEPFLFIEDEPIPRGQLDRDYIALYEEQKTQKILEDDGFKRRWQDGIDFFKNHYPIIEREWMPFWRIGWDWQKY